MTDLVEVVAVRPRLLLAQPARVDAEHVEEELDILGPALADHGEPDAAALCPRSRRTVT